MTDPEPERVDIPWWAAWLLLVGFVVGMVVGTLLGVLA